MVQCSGKMGIATMDNMGMHNRYVSVYCSNKQQQPCVVVRPVHTSLCSSYLIAHVYHCHPPPTHSFVLGTTVINNNNLNYSQKRVSTTLIMNSATTIALHSRGQSRYDHNVLCSSSMT